MDLETKRGEPAASSLRSISDWTNTSHTLVVAKDRLHIIANR